MQQKGGRPVPGVDKAFVQRLAERYHAPLMAYFMRRVYNEAEAKDLTQEVFFRIASRTNAADIHNAEAFLFRTAVNLLRDRARREKTRLQHQMDLPDHEESSEVFSPERVVQGKEQLQVVLSAMAELGEKTRDIFVLHRLENMKYQEIAELYGISASAVEKHMMKALAHLAKYMGAE